MRALILELVGALAGAAVANDSDYYTNSSGHQVHRPEHARHAGRLPSAETGPGASASITRALARIMATLSLAALLAPPVGEGELDR